MWQTPQSSDGRNRYRIANQEWVPGLNGDIEMRSCIAAADNRSASRHPKSPSRGFTLVEMLVTLVIGVTLTAMSLPMVMSSVANYQRTSAVSAVTGAIRSARYAAIYQGNTFRLKFTQATSSFQLSSAPTNTSVFTNVGSAVPLQGSLGADTTLEFHPSGVVKPVPAANPMTVALTYGGIVETITVTSSYGDISVTP
jgi:prepilin-type N-terminal cleavage/methylation domain-containing protein